MWTALAKVACPILKVRGTNSAISGADTIDRVKSSNGKLSLVEVEFGHNVGTENPEALLAQVSKFLNRSV